MIKQDLNLFLFQIIKKKNLVFFLIFLLINNCSFDNKTGIWRGDKEEKKRFRTTKSNQKPKDFYIFSVIKIGF